MTEKKDLWLVFLLGIFTCGIYNIVVAVTALKSIYKLNGDERAFEKRIVYWILYYAGYYILLIAYYVTQFTGTVMAEVNNFDSTGLAVMLGTMGVIWIVWLLFPIISLFLYYHEFGVLTDASNKFGIKTTQGYKMAVVLLGAANVAVASLILQARLNKLVDLQNTRPTAPTTPSMPNTPSDNETSKELLDF